MDFLDQGPFVTHERVVFEQGRNKNAFESI